MKLIRTLALCVLLAGTVSACHPPSTIVTPQGQAAWTADEVVQRLTELSNAVKADTGTQPANIRPKDAFTIIEWISGDANAKDAQGNPSPTKGITQAVETAGLQGIKPAALHAYTDTIKPLLQKYPQIAIYVSILDAILGVQ